MLEKCGRNCYKLLPIVFQLFESKYVSVEEFLKLLIREIDAKLLKSIHLEVKERVRRVFNTFQP